MAQCNRKDQEPRANESTVLVAEHNSLRTYGRSGSGNRSSGESSAGPTLPTLEYHQCREFQPSSCVLARKAQLEKAGSTMTEQELAYCKAFIERHLELGLIRPSSADLCSKAFAAKDAQGLMGFYIDYQPMAHTLSNRSAYPVPGSKARSAHLATCSGGVYSTMRIQLHHCAYACCVEPADRRKTAFSVDGVQKYEWLVMPFDFPGSHSTWQQLMDRMVHVLPHTKVFRDEVIVVSKSWQEHIQEVQRTLSRCSRHRIPLDPSQTVMDMKVPDKLGEDEHQMLCTMWVLVVALLALMVGFVAMVSKRQPAVANGP